nr:alpha-1,6-glucosidase domain-containing protein [Clostridium saudiense]
MNKLIAGIILTSQGISFVHAGEEMARTKEDEEGKLVENSFESSDKVNKIYWDRKVKYKDLFEYYKGLISLRKEYKAFRMNTNEEIKENIHFLKKGVNFSENNLVAYIIDAKNIDIKCEKIAVIINANNKDVDVELEESNWHVMVDEKTAGNEIIETIKDSKVNVSRKSIKVLIK